MGFVSKISRRFMAILLLGALVMTMCFLHISKRTNKQTALPRTVEMGCKIPDVDPFDKSIAEYVQLNGKLTCNGKPSITYEDGDTVHVNWTVVNNYYKGEITSCRYQPITRGPQKSDSHFILGNLSEPFSEDMKIEDEFIKIYCTNNLNSTVYTNFHARIIPKSGNEQSHKNNFGQHEKINKPRETLNVLLIGVDSVSRLNSIRQMPLVRKYLLEELEAVEMKGYTKVADNTFVNVVPILTGKFVEELPWNETQINEPFDRYNFIWKNFSQDGYTTLYAEDAPHISAFNYFKKGFHDPPTDHYLRPFNVAMDKEASVWNTKHHCVGDRLEMDIVLNYMLEFARKYHDQPHFGFIFTSRLTHDNINAAGVTDDPHLRFFKTLKKENLLNNTVAIFFSDHGMRFGPIRKTYIGKVEERMPFLFFVLPKWFRGKYSMMVQNMESNAQKLTTPFDVYETMKDILFFNGETKMVDRNDRGTSLFNEVSRDRSCDVAGILPHWCVCLETQNVSASSSLVKDAGEVILKYINKKLTRLRGACAVLSINAVHSAVSMTPNSQVLRFKDSLNDVLNRIVLFGKRTKAKVILQLTVVTSPGDGLFEATVSFDESKRKYEITGDISRINKYGNQSICIGDFELKKYCFCQ